MKKLIVEIALREFPLPHLSSSLASSASLMLLVAVAACSNPEPEPTRRSANLLPPPNTSTPAIAPATQTSVPTSVPTATITVTPGPTSLPPEYVNSYWALQISDALSPGLDSGFDVMGRSADGGIVAAGEPYVPYVEKYDQILKLSESGEVQWRYAVTAEQESKVRIRYHLPTSDGGALVGMWTAAPEENTDVQSAPALLRFASDGSLLWERSFSGRPLQETDDRGFMLLGPDNDLRRLNMAGDVLWVKEIELTTPLGIARPEFGRELPGGGLLVGGYELTYAQFRPRNNAIGGRDYPTRLWFAGISSNDEVLWKRYFVFRGFAGAMPTSDGGMAIAGGSYIEDTDYIWLLKITSDGEISFWKRYRELSFGWAVQKGPDGSFLFMGTGPVTEGDFGLADNRVMKVNRQGFGEWVINFGREIEPDFASPLEDGSPVMLFPGGWFYRFGPDGSLPECEATLHQVLDVRTTDVVQPPDQADVVEGPIIRDGSIPNELSPEERPTIRLDPLPWDIREVCRYFP